MTWFFLVLTNFLFLILFARTLVRTDDREWIFNPHLLWAGHITDRIGRVATDIFPGLHIRGGTLIGQTHSWSSSTSRDCHGTRCLTAT